MSCAFKDIAAVDQVAVSTPDVTIVMPCLNEMQMGAARGRNYVTLSVRATQAGTKWSPPVR